MWLMIHIIYQENITKVLFMDADTDVLYGN